MATAALLALAAAATPAPARVPLTPARYKQAVAPITSCQAFAQRFAGLPYAAPLLRRLFAEGIPEQSSAENSDDFVRRVVDRLFARLGDPSRIYASVPLGDQSRYDAATETMTVRFPVPYEAKLDMPREVEGADDPSLRTVSELKGLFEFPPGVLPEELQFRMSPADATRFRTGGKLQLIALFQDYGTDQAKTATQRTDYRLVRLTPKCALVSNTGVAVPGWRYDGWKAVSTP